MKTGARNPSGLSKQARQLISLHEDGIYQLHVSLAGSDPLIWRRIQVPGHASLTYLHHALQIVMGWQESHLHEFIIDGRHYANPEWDDDGFGPKLFPERKFHLKDLSASARKSFRYIYDFGDGWIHEVKVEAILPSISGAKYPVCLEGANASPPEDSGGLGGYYEKLRIMQDPNDPEYEDIKEWMGRFDPSAFSLEAVNRALRAFSRKRA
jgi:hypothetical protein